MMTETTLVSDTDERTEAAPVLLTEDELAAVGGGTLWSAFIALIKGEYNTP